MASELSILAIYAFVIVLTLVVQLLLALPQFGLPYLASSRDEGRVLSGMAGRAERCYNNSVLAMAMFAPAVLALAAMDAFTAKSQLACQVFLVARIAYAPAYWLGIPWARTLIWVVGLLMTLWLYLMVLGAA